MQDDRWQQDDDTNANGERPYLDRRPVPGRVRPAAKQPDHRGPPTPEEIEAFVSKEFGSEKPERKKLIRPPGWDGPEPVKQEPEQAERGDAWEGDEK